LPLSGDPFLRHLVCEETHGEIAAYVHLVSRREALPTESCVRFSETVRANAVDEKLRTLSAERAASIPEGIAENTRPDSTSPSLPTAEMTSILV
jgi:hypothetical protein